MGKEKALAFVLTQGPDAIGIPSTGLSLGWLLASRANLRFTRQEKGYRHRIRRRQEQSMLPVWKTGKSVAKERSFFVQTMGSTSCLCHRFKFGFLVIQFGLQVLQSV